MSVGDAYSASGVDYNALDEFKRFAQSQASSTAPALHAFGMNEVGGCRGESAYLIELPDRYLAFVEEGLGTKNLVADAMEALMGKTYYDAIAQDTIAAIVNDLITSGAQPFVIAMHCAAGSSEWMNNRARWTALVNGWKAACDAAGATWGPGETPALNGMVEASTVVLSGSAIGQIAPKTNRIAGNVKEGDEIILVESSGIHANGLTLARTLIERQPEGYLTRLPDGRSMGEALLRPGHLYSTLLGTILNNGIVPHYCVHITGHGWRKLMRLDPPLTYHIDSLPPVLPEFVALQKWGNLSDEEMYGTFNMGVGFALYVAAEQAEETIAIAKQVGFSAWRSGRIQTSPTKQVVIEPKNIVYTGATLKVR
ncbi:phosphoribosylformylglycinamidine cyclo-ligase [Candidatus Uhrbacteria bacterium]|nr:phosphoribosylformylglycinamidine cyclo-ligase [Candidatus Uhrbacteria bacterium]